MTEHQGKSLLEMIATVRKEANEALCRHNDPGTGDVGDALHDAINTLDEWMQDVEDIQSLQAAVAARSKWPPPGDPGLTPPDHSTHAALETCWTQIRGGLWIRCDRYELYAAKVPIWEACLLAAKEGPPLRRLLGPRPQQLADALASWWFDFLAGKGGEPQ